MSSTQRLERLLRLVNLLQSGRQFNTRELSEILGVSRRTIFRDINLLQDCGVQIQFSEERQEGNRHPVRFMSNRSISH